MEKTKDRDFVETLNGFLFCFVCYLNPPDGYSTYLKYGSVPGGKQS